MVPDQGKQQNKSPEKIAVDRIISYNFREDERPGGIKIRAKIRIVRGREAEAVNRAQAEAIRELLLWSRQHRMQQEQEPRPPAP
jgi:hypothetical protein